MILKKLAQLETELISSDESLEAVNSIKLLLNEVDFSAELIPLENTEKFKKLLIFIKGSDLAPNEIDIFYKLLQN